MKSFKYNYTLAVRILLVLAVILSGVGGGWNIYSIVEYSPAGILKVLPYAVICALSLFFFILTLSMLFFSRYEIKNNTLVSKLGFLVSKINLDRITKIAKFLNENKLVIYYDREKFAVVFISPETYDDFISALLKSNKDIEYVLVDENSEKDE